MIWVAHPTGNTFVRALLAGLVEAKSPFRFFTSFGVAEARSWWRRLPSRARAEVERRAYRLPDGAMVTRPAREMARLACQRMGWKRAVRHETGWFSVDAVYRDLDASVARRLRRAAPGELPRAVYAYEDGALESFKSARDRGVRRVYELPIAHWETSRRLLEEEARRRPDWEPTLQATRDSAAKTSRKTAELEMAEAVVCPSKFVLDSLPEAARRAKKCLVAPFGSPEGPAAPPRDDSRARPLRFLFAGTMTQRKGLADLFDAVKLLGRGDYELVVLGSLVAPMSFYRERLPNFVYEPPRSHREVLELMASCDVLVLPSIVEGRALVQQEALSAGLPLIVTPNAGGEDLIDEGETGFLAPIRSPAAIAERMAWFLERRAELGRMRDAARRKAAERGWQAYAGQILGLLESMQ
jgi:glycosyltransferase involved in cell wall biosynthesis